MSTKMLAVNDRHNHRLIDQHPDAVHALASIVVNIHLMDAIAETFLLEDRGRSLDQIKEERDFGAMPWGEYALEALDEFELVAAGLATGPDAGGSIDLFWGGYRRWGPTDDPDLKWNCQSGAGNDDLSGIVRLFSTTRQVVGLVQETNLTALNAALVPGVGGPRPSTRGRAAPAPGSGRGWLRSRSGQFVVVASGRKRGRLSSPTIPRGSQTNVRGPHKVYAASLKGTGAFTLNITEADQDKDLASTVVVSKATKGAWKRMNQIELELRSLLKKDPVGYWECQYIQYGRIDLEDVDDEVVSVIHDWIRLSTEVFDTSSEYLSEVRRINQGVEKTSQLGAILGSTDERNPQKGAVAGAVIFGLIGAAAADANLK